MDNDRGTSATATEPDSSRVESNGASKPQRPTKAKPAKVLPTDRILAAKQLEIIRAYGITSSADRKPVSNTDAANMVGLKESTVAQTNSFFTDIGVLVKAEAPGTYVPGADVFEFCRAYEWNSDTAAHKLAPLIARSWFAQRLIPKLAFRELSEDAALADLAEEASAGPDRKSQLELLLYFLEIAGLITRQDGVVRKSQTAPHQAGTAASHEKPNVNQEAPEHGAGRQNTPPARGMGGGVEFHVSIQTDMAELSTWSADRITAFFSGLAQVLAAKKGLEERK